MYNKLAFSWQCVIATVLLATTSITFFLIFLAQPLQRKAQEQLLQTRLLNTLKVKFQNYVNEQQREYNIKYLHKKYAHALPQLLQRQLGTTILENTNLQLKASAITINSITPLKKQVQNGVIIQSINIQGQASFAQLMAYMEHTLRSTLILKITQFALNHLGEFTATLEVYHR